MGRTLQQPRTSEKRKAKKRAWQARREAKKLAQQGTTSEDTKNEGSYVEEDVKEGESPMKKQRIEDVNEKNPDISSHEANAEVHDFKANAEVSDCSFKEQLGVKEGDVGITEYISSHKGFSGTIKQRFSDFMVNEIDKEGNVIHLTDTTVPPDDEKVDDTVLTVSQQRELQELADSKNTSMCVMIEVGDEKERRGKVHQAIRKGFSNLESGTSEENGLKVIKVTYKPKHQQSDRRYWPAERGEYCRFVLYKENKDTMDAVNLLAKMMRMKPSLFSYAGTKDRRAKTSQLMTIKRTEAKRLEALNKGLRGIVLGNFVYTKEPLSLGDLKGNQFTIVLRNLSGDVSQIEEAISSLKERGFINYFGMQRFGTGNVPTHHIGRALLQGRWSRAIQLILQPQKKDEDDMEKARKHWQKTKDAQASLNLLPSRQSIERHLLIGLSKCDQNDLVSALGSIPRNQRLMYVHAYQSYVWNTITSRRIRRHGLEVIKGDLVMKAGFIRDEKPVVVTEENISTFSIHDVVLPLPGFDVMYPDNLVAQWYREMLDEAELTDLRHKVKDYSLPGGYRHIVHLPSNVSWSTSFYDDVNKSLVLSDFERLREEPEPEAPTSGKFQAGILKITLTSAVYATMALREIMKQDTSASQQALLNVT